MSEEEQIRAAVEQRKQRARELGIVDNVFKLYREHLRYLKSDFNHDSSCMPNSVTKISSNSRTASSPETIEVCIGADSYSFSFCERFSYAPDDDGKWGSLEVKQDGALLLELKCMGKDDRYMGMMWSVFDVGAFREGPWVAEINRFAAQVFSLAGQRRAQAERAQKQREVEDLKKKFGL